VGSEKKPAMLEVPKPVAVSPHEPPGRVADQRSKIGDEVALVREASSCREIGPFDLMRRRQLLQHLAEADDPLGVLGRAAHLPHEEAVEVAAADPQAVGELPDRWSTLLHSNQRGVEQLGRACPLPPRVVEDCLEKLLAADPLVRLAGERCGELLRTLPPERLERSGPIRHERCGGPHDGAQRRGSELEARDEEASVAMGGVDGAEGRA
jgi:hypothetical protein